MWRKNIFITRLPILVALTITTAAAQTSLPTFLSLSTSTTWKDFTLNRINNKPQKRWVWAGTVTIKSKKPITISNVTLQWCGDNIQKLHATLYHKKDTEHQLIPIQENMLCDGEWNPKTQQLMFPMNKKIVAVNHYYLVLSFPEKDIEKIKHGSFITPPKNPIGTLYVINN